MSIISNLDKLKLINSEIKNERTGTPDEFAKKLHISRSMLYNYMEEIKTLGAKLIYSRSNNTFYYKNGFDIKIGVYYENHNIKNVIKHNI